MFELLDFSVDHPNLWWWRAKVMKVVDGDTVDLFIDEGRRRYSKERIRFEKIDAWETRGKEKEKGKAAKEWLMSHLATGAEIIVHTTGADNRGGFGRWLAQIWKVATDEDLEIIDEQVEADLDLINEFDIDKPLINLGEWMLEIGHARLYKKK